MTVPTISKRGGIIPMSAMRKLTPLAQAAKARGVRVIHLNIGQPDIETPPEYWEAVCNFPKHEPTLAYAPSVGRPELIESLVKYYHHFDIEIAAANVVVTVGGSEASLFAFAACGDAGDEVIVPEPYYSNYKGVAAIVGVELVPFTTYVADGYHLPSRAAIEEKITARTRAILYSSPGNPTGTVYTRAEVQMLCEIAQEHGLFLLADEVYREFAYDGEAATSALHLPGFEQNVVILDSVSKRYSACGARIGCVISHNKEFMQAITKLAMSRLSAPALDQIGAAACVHMAPDYTEQVRAEYTRRRDLVVSRLNEIEGVTCHSPKGAFYVMPRIEGVDAEEFAKWLLTDFEEDGETVMIAPGPGFYATPGLGQDEIRIAYVLKLDRLARAMDLLASAIGRYRNRA